MAAFVVASKSSRFGASALAWAVLVTMTGATVGRSQENTDVLPSVPDGAQAVSLSGRSLIPATPGAKQLEQLRLARARSSADPQDADLLIWLGRRTAYCGRFRESIRIFSDGIRRHPSDARMYRHRGHRYISIRQFDRAIKDLRRAAELIEGKPNEVEPDGLPNALGIPVSSLHGNIWYHLGLAWYLKQDFEQALRCFDKGYAISRNDDNRVSTTHWRYMILRRLGRRADADRILEPIHSGMSVIENHGYHRLCLFYKGQLTEEELTKQNGDDPASAAVAYGVANKVRVDGDERRGRELLTQLAARRGWSAFGVIAAEADLAAK